MNKFDINSDETSRVIEMAWEDRTPFEAIAEQFSLSESDVIALMRKKLKASAFKNWRARVSGRKTKHLKIRSKKVVRMACKTQYKHGKK